MYKVVIKGIVSDIDKEQFLFELSQHGKIESLELDGETATVTVADREVAQGLYMDYNGRNLRGKPVTAELSLPN